MSYKVQPFFKSHYSIGRSILTLSSEEKTTDKYPNSIFALCKENDISTFFLVEDSISGFLESIINSKKFNTKVIYGLRFTTTSDIETKNEASLKGNSKIVLLAKNTEGYNELYKIYSLAAKDGFYYEPRLDRKSISKFDLKNLQLVIPFYDSFIDENNFKCSSCIPDFLSLFNEPKLAIEDNLLPFDHLIKEEVIKFAKEFNYETINTKSIYYNKKEDFRAYMSFRCIHNRTTLNKPNFSHMCSDQFSFESWKQQNN